MLSGLEIEKIEISSLDTCGEAVEAEVERKIGFLPIRGRKTIRTALVYDGELSPAVRENGYFDVLLSAREWLCFPT